ncbi:MAG TPA: hypothetical protein VIK74_02915 [Parasegetibacter sp.]
MRPLLTLLSLLLSYYLFAGNEFTGNKFAGNNHGAPRLRPMVITPFSVQLTNVKSYNRPVRAGEFDGGIDYTKQLTVDDFDANETMVFNYSTQDIFPQTTGTYSIIVTNATMNTSEPGLEHDTFIFLYEEEFDPGNPLQNLVRANDDKSEDDFTSHLTNITLEAGKKYIIVMTSYEQNVTGEAEFEVDGPGSVLLSLPVTWLSVTATPKNSNIIVIWKTAEEINTAYYDVERSTDNQKYSSVYRTRTAKGPGINTYQFTDDQQLKPGSTYFYRIRLTDLDGSISYSDVTKAVLSGPVNKISVLENPFRNNVGLNLVSAERTTVVAEITDVNGKKLLSQSWQLEKGVNSLTLATRNFARGYYFLTIIGTNRERIGEIQLLKK